MPDPYLPANPPFIPTLPAVSSQPLPTPVNINPAFVQGWAPPVPFIATGAQVPPTNNPAKPNKA